MATKAIRRRKVKGYPWHALQATGDFFLIPGRVAPTRGLYNGPRRLGFKVRVRRFEHSCKVERIT